jgi:NAD(P)-dependent dehydrogenase (short-subunit alcohol dehydrogenase family)
MRLENKVALVTGGGRGIGRAIALGLAKEGADVAISYVSHPDEAAETVAAIEALGRQGLAVRADSRVKADVDNLVAETVRTFNRLDILVNNSGVASFTPFLEVTEEEYDRVVDTNMKGYFLVGQAAARQMVEQGGGKIVNIVSEAQQKALPNLAHYCASKGGALMLSRGMALDLAKYKINVNIVAPGPTITDMNRERLKVPGEVEKRIVRIPWGRMGNPEDMVGAVVYLVSAEAENVTGACIAVDGGTTIV